MFSGPCLPQVIKSMLPSKSLWETGIAFSDPVQRAALEKASTALHGSKILSQAGDMVSVLKNFEASVLHTINPRGTAWGL